MMYAVQYHGISFTYTQYVQKFILISEDTIDYQIIGYEILVKHILKVISIRKSKYCTIPNY